MTKEFTFIFWMSFGIVLYTFLGYAIVLYVLVKIKQLFTKSTLSAPATLPNVTLLIAAYNEEKIIEEKIKNSLQLKYPAGKLQIALVIDGSNDATFDIANKYKEQISIYFEKERKGKIAAVNRVMPLLNSEIVVFSDANTFIDEDTISTLVAHFNNKAVGCVAGEKQIRIEKNDTASASGEGFYWKYESFLKKYDSELSSAIGAAGELFAIRAALFTPIENNTIVEDFVMSLNLIKKGYKVHYEPKAVSLEYGSATINEELKRKIRIAAGCFQALGHTASLLNFFRYGWFSFQYFSHKVLRWTLAPLALIFIFISNVFLLNEGVFYAVFFGLQTTFYVLAVIGYLLRNKSTGIKAAFVPYYFFIMNYAVLAGFVRFLKGNQSVIWDKAVRK